MSSFTEPLVVKKRKDGLWEIAKSFRYYIGHKGSTEYIDIPKDFVTDFASVPRPLWPIIPPDGSYTQAAVVHDYLYSTQSYSRKISDKVFLEAMKVLGVSFWKRYAMYRAVRLFGGFPWRMRRNLKIKEKKK